MEEARSFYACCEPAWREAAEEKEARATAKVETPADAREETEARAEMAPGVGEGKADATAEAASAEAIGGAGEPAGGGAAMGGAQAGAGEASGGAATLGAKARAKALLKGVAAVFGQRWSWRTSTPRGGADRFACLLEEGTPIETPRRGHTGGVGHGVGSAHAVANAVAPCSPSERGICVTTLFSPIGGGGCIPGGWVAAR